MKMCPVCCGRNFSMFLRRESVPVHQNLLFTSAQNARTLASGALAMTVCRDCSFVFNADFNPELLSYGQYYDNSQNFSPAFETHVNNLVARLVDERGVRGCSVVEVGCGKGEFLRKLAGPKEFGNTGHGFDPAYVGPDEDFDGRVRFYRQFYTEECSQISADVVISRHVIEHVPEPRVLLSSIRDALQASPQAKVFFETPCVEWILKHQVAWDFFYEHCSLFTAASLKTVFEESGFHVVSVDHVFEGQYLWLEAELCHQPALQTASDVTDRNAFIRLADDFGISERTRNTRWLQSIRRQRETGAIALWGAGAKGVTLANLIDPEQTLFECVVDVNPNKQGRFLAGTGHPIVAPDELGKRGITTVFVLNPNYCSEIRARLARSSCPVMVVDLMREGALAS